MISKVRAPPTPARPSTVDVAVKKLAARASGYVGSSAFEVAKRSGKVLGGVAQTAPEVRRATARDFKQILSGLRKGNDASVRLGVSEVGARLGLKLPELSRLSGWHAVGALGTALGHSTKATFNPRDFHGVQEVATKSRSINDPDPSNGRLA